MGALDLYIQQMPNSTLQSTRVYWRDMLHIEQLPPDVELYESKKKSSLDWFNSAGMARSKTQ